jgi:hypothetical protein
MEKNKEATGIKLSTATGTLSATANAKINFLTLSLIPININQCWRIQSILTGSDLCIQPDPDPT